MGSGPFKNHEDRASRVSSQRQIKLEIKPTFPELHDTELLNTSQPPPLFIFKFDTETVLKCMQSKDLFPSGQTLELYNYLR